ncbi:P-loop containing nucleoside triphosphate hydrolase protein [Phyllosticta citriasiana]|uniref:P-loop containing nucleoside triphosphate hydrolase protein n=1 Tax=Phyllosticta citriasiana TaxID=595635 RepID=UPI0030FD729B
MDLEASEVGMNAKTQATAQADRALDAAGPAEDIRPANRYVFNGSREELSGAARELFEEGRQASDHFTDTAVSLSQSPARLLPTKLKNCQMEGVGFLCQQVDKRGYALLADGKGLGKTIELIALMMERPVKPNLVVCPADLVEMWVGELQNRVQNPPFEVLHLSSFTDRHLLIRAHVIPDDVNDLQPTASISRVLTWLSAPSIQGEYLEKVEQQETLTEERLHVAALAIHLGRVIVDEAHAIRDVLSSANAAVCALKSHQRIACTATPLVDGHSDISAILNFLQLKPWGDLKVFREPGDMLDDEIDEARHGMLVMFMRALMLRLLPSDHFDGQRIQDIQNP